MNASSHGAKRTHSRKTRRCRSRLFPHPPTLDDLSPLGYLSLCTWDLLRVQWLTLQGTLTFQNPASRMLVFLLLQACRRVRTVLSVKVQRVRRGMTRLAFTRLPIATLLQFACHVHSFLYPSLILPSAFLGRGRRKGTDTKGRGLASFIPWSWLSRLFARETNRPRASKRFIICPR